MRFGGAPQGRRRDRGDCRTRGFCLLAALSLACGGASSDRPAPYRRHKSAEQLRDSSVVARLAIATLTDSTKQLTLRVDQFTRGSNGYLVRLLPVGAGTAGGGTVWVDEDGSATVVKRY